MNSKSEKQLNILIQKNNQLMNSKKNIQKIPNYSYVKYLSKIMYIYQKK